MDRKFKRKKIFLPLLIVALLASLISGCTPQAGGQGESFYVFTTAVPEATATPEVTDMPEVTAEITEPSPTAGPVSDSGETAGPAIDENGIYTTKEDVALYIHVYGKLPQNFITKKEAEKLGWSGGSVEKYAPGKCIGGAKFGNYEGLLPEKDGRTYTECDIDTLGANSRGAKRIVFSNDGLIYYTEDHYESFTLLYGEE